ncbi:MAG TPA: helix-turn-helix transcriptional regulator [Bacillota bacterium]|nr:helix-turn-helix transcriptional regulator [Bacillota bacterium]
MDTDLRERIGLSMEEKSLNRTNLSRKTGIHLSEISRILNHKQSLSLKKLDLITIALDLPEGSFYPYYINECFNESGILDKRKSEQFIYKCVTMDYDEHQVLLDLVVEERSKTIRNKNCIYIFLAAEQLFESGFENKALSLYEFIIENMPDHFSQEVAVSYFRRFYILRLTDEGKYAIGHVLEHIAYMPESFQILSYVWITATFYVQRKWKESLYYALKLEKMAVTEEHYGRALLYQSLAITSLGGTLDEVLTLIDRYEKINDYYADLAIGNRYCAYLDFGRYDYVDEYFNWLKGRDDIVAGLPRILEAYVQLRRFDDVKQLLIGFQKVIQDWSTNVHPYQQQMYLRFRYAYAMYLFEKGYDSDGLFEVLEVARTSRQIGNLDRFNQCLLVYWKYKDSATVEHEDIYIEMLEIKNISKMP